MKTCKYLALIATIIGLSAAAFIFMSKEDTTKTGIVYINGSRYTGDVVTNNDSIIVVKINKFKK